MLPPDPSPLDEDGGAEKTELADAEWFLGKVAVGSTAYAPTQREAQVILDALATLRASLGRVEATMAKLHAGPYDVRECRGHWHVTNGEYDVDGGSHYDEHAARARAAELSAQWNVSKEAVEVERDEAIEQLSATAARLATMTVERDDALAKVARLENDMEELYQRGE